MICGFDVEEVYVEEFEEMANGHHIKPLNEIGIEYIVDIIKDLVLICPNGYMIFHSTNNNYTLEELKIRSNL